MRYFICFMLGVVISASILLFFGRSFLKSSIISLSNTVDKSKMINENCYLKQNGIIVGELYKGLIIRHLSNDELKRFNIEFALDKYSNLKLSDSDNNSFIELVPVDNVVN